MAVPSYPPNPITIDRGYTNSIRSYLRQATEDYPGDNDAYDGPGDYYYNGGTDPSHVCGGHDHGYYTPPPGSYWVHTHYNYHRSYYTTIATKSGADWYLYRAGDYDIIGSNSGRIVTNHGGVSGPAALATTTLNFTSAGTLYVSTGDTINIKANHGAVELQDDITPTTVSPYWAGWGTVNLVGGDDTVNVNAHRLGVNGGSGSDSIRIDQVDNIIDGGDGNDSIIAITDYNNQILGGNGEDTIIIKDSDNWLVDGESGSDIISIGSVNRYVYGGAGADSIVGHNSNSIHGGGRGGADGNDTIKANDSNMIWGDDGVDSIVANNSNKIWGNKDGDSIWGNDFNFISGGGAADTIFASEYNTVYGGVSGSTADNDDGGLDNSQGDGADSITVEIGNKVYGGGGNDSIYGQYANLIAGGEGDDSIVALDKDSIAGGNGQDCIKAGEHAYIDAGPGNDTVDAKFNSSIWGGSGIDSINVLDRSYVNAGDDNDSVYATNDSTLFGGGGNDTIEATDGNLIYGDINALSSIASYSMPHGANLDYLTRTENSGINGNLAGDDIIQVKNLNTIHGGWGKDSIIGSDFNLSYGDAGSDSIFLESNNSIWGGAGSDIIQATDFNLIYGDDSAGSDAGWGNDSVVARTDNTIYGGAGNDTLIADDRAKIDGGIGNDSLTFGQNSSIIAGEGDDTIVSQAPGALTAPNGSSGSSIWGGKGGVDTLGHAINYVDSVGSGVDGKGHAYTAKPYGGREIHGHNIYTGADADVTIMDFKFGNDVIHFGRAFEASAVTAFGYGNSTIVPTTDYQIYTAGTDRINVAATISDAANIDMREEAGKFVMFGNPNGTLKGGFANTLLGGKNDDTIYVGEGDYVYGGIGNDTINLNGYNNWRDHVGLTEEGGTDTINSFQQGWGEGDDVIWYNVPLKKQAVGDDGKLLFDTDHNPIYTDANTDAVADLNDANVRVVGDTTVLSQGKAKLILKGVTHGEILAKDADGVHRVALLGQGYYNDSTRGGQIFIGRKEYSDIVSFEKNNHDLVVDLGMTDRFKDKSAKYYNIEQIIGGSGNNTIVGAKNVRNTLDGGIGTSSIWGGGASADVMVSGTGSATDHYTTFFYGAGDGYDTIEGFRTTDRNDAHFKRDILDIHSGDVSSVRKVGTSIVVNMAGSTDRLTIRNAASGLFDQLIEVNVKGRKGAAKVTGADEIVTYDPHAQYYFSNAVMGGTVRNFGDNTRIYLDGRTGDYYKGITNIDVDRGNRLELAGDAANNRITYSGRGTASLYGGLGNDTMTGSKDGTNRFFFGRSDGNDIITKSTVNDKVMLYDVALEEVVSAEEKKGSMRIALKSGASLTIQNFDAKSVHDFTLATGDTWVYNHNATGTGGYWSPKGNYPVAPKA